MKNETCEINPKRFSLGPNYTVFISLFSLHTTKFHIMKNECLNTNIPCYITVIMHFSFLCCCCPSPPPHASSHTNTSQSLTVSQRSSPLSNSQNKKMQQDTRKEVVESSRRFSYSPSKVKDANDRRKREMKALSVLTKRLPVLLEYVALSLVRKTR